MADAVPFDDVVLDAFVFAVVVVVQFRYQIVQSSTLNVPYSY